MDYDEMLAKATAALEEVAVIENKLWPGTDAGRRAFDAAKQAHDKVAMLVGELTVLTGLVRRGLVSPRSGQEDV